MKSYERKNAENREKEKRCILSEGTLAFFLLVVYRSIQANIAKNIYRHSKGTLKVFYFARHYNHYKFD